MKRSIFTFFFCSALLSAAPLNVVFVDPGNPALAVNGVYVGPYTLSINGVATPAMCMDDFLEVYNGDQWSANKTSVTSSDFSNTYLGNSGKTILGQAYTSSQIYTAEAYLFSLLTRPGADRGDIQKAAWAIMNPDTLSSVINSNDTAVEGYLQDAAAHYSTFDAGSYSIISQTGAFSGSSKQEFMISSAPEPATFALFGGALLAAGLARFFKRRKT